MKTYYDGQESELAPTNGKGNFLMGKVSYSEKLDEAGQSISRTWYSYDERGRVVWMVQDIAGLGAKSVAYAYGPTGNVRLVSYQAGDEAEDFYHYYEYDADTRLKAVYTDNEPPVYRTTNELRLLDEAETKAAFDLQASYTYYLHGPLKKVVLADGLQKTDYYYTVQGWLKAINNPNNTGNADNDGSVPDVFSMQLDYFAGDYEKAGTSIQPHTLALEDYSGNIQQQQWRTQKPAIDGGGFATNAYQYDYDQRYQLKSAIFGTMNNGTFAKDASDFYSTTQLDYDRNGNITDLYRTKGELETADDFVGKYKYVKKEGIEINQLDKVEGYADYGYNAIGQMVAQESLAGSEVPTQYIRYDVSGKAIAVYGSATQDEVTKQWAYVESTLKYRYCYDERGFRVRKEDKANDRNTYYLRDASGSLLSVYEPNKEGVLAPSEVPVYGSSRIGLYRPSGQYVDYELKDHLGNVRAIIGNASGEADVKYQADYFAFGKPLNSKGTASRFQYQGAFAEKDDKTGYNSFQLRQYDATIGRWLSTDPAGQYWSPYVGMGNDPANLVDPDGAYTWLGAWIRNGFSRDGLVNSGGEWGIRRTGDMVTEQYYSGLGDQLLEVSYAETYTDFGNFGEGWGDQHAYFTSPNYRSVVDDLAAQDRPLATGAIEPVYPETYFMPIPNFGQVALASKTLNMASKTINIGRYKVAREVFHRQIKPRILSAVAKEHSNFHRGCISRFRI